MVPCASNAPGAFKCRNHHLTTDQRRRRKERKVRMADVENIVKGTVALNTREAVRRYEAFNKEKGTRTS